MKRCPLLGGALPIALSLLFCASRAAASPLLDATGSVGGNGGAQGVVSGPSSASTYFNPALLVDAEDSALVAFALSSEQIGVVLDGRRGGDVPLSVGSRNVLGPGLQPLPNDVVPTQWLTQGCPPGTQAGTCPAPGFAARPRQSAGTSGKTRTYLTLGFAKKLIPDRLAIGLYAMLPVGNLTTAQAFYPDEREALFSNSLHPELYGDRLTAVSIVLGAAFALLPQLSIGAGVSIGLANRAASATYVQNSADYSTLLMNNSVTTTVNVSPTLGLRYRPASFIRFGAVVHAPESFTIETALDATLPSGTASGTSRRDVYDWTPWSIGGGAEVDVLRRGEKALSLVGSATLGLWSAYEDRHGQSPASYGGDLGWKDTVSGAVGVRYVNGPGRAFVDLTYAPSPVPAQVGRSNYVDNDRVGIVLGGDYELRLGTLRVRPGAQFLCDRVIYRHNTKDDTRIVDELPDGSVFGTTHAPVPGSQGLQTNNPGWPGFASEGWFWGGAVTLAVPL
jgi:long-chain fatty acid transport protein